MRRFRFILALAAAFPLPALAQPFAPQSVVRTGRQVEALAPERTGVAVIRRPVRPTTTEHAGNSAGEPVRVRVGTVVVTVDPLKRIRAAGNRGLERARIDTLRRRGIVGGVRIFHAPFRAAVCAPSRALTRDAAPVRMIRARPAGGRLAARG